MSEVHTDQASIDVDSVKGEPPASGREHGVYTYESAGIAEREGSVPGWLWGVVALLLMWGIYYLVAYWNAPIGPTL